MVEFGGAVRFPVGVEIEAGTLAEREKTRHVADRRIQPDVEELARRVGDLEAEIGCVARNVPVAQSCLEPFLDLVRCLALQRTATVPAVHLPAIAQPVLEELAAGAEAEEMMF